MKLAYSAGFIAFTTSTDERPNNLQIYCFLLKSKEARAVVTIAAALKIHKNYIIYNRKEVDLVAGIGPSMVSSIIISTYKSTKELIQDS